MYLTRSELTEAKSLSKKELTVYEKKRLIKLYIKERKYQVIPVCWLDEDHELFETMLNESLKYFRE